MLRMMIADDEKIIRETICNIIDWNAIGVQIIGMCKNGIEAYDMILDEYPDMVLTDIKMPGLSGLELIRRITQAGQKTEFIILSGYGDYEYTKVAMKYGIQHYLLKPCTVEEITEVVQAAKKQCYRRKARDLQDRQDFLTLKKLHESVVFNLLTESMSEAPDYARLRQQYEYFLSFTAVSYEVCCFIGLREGACDAVYAAMAAYHEGQAPGIPLYALQADTTLYFAFESYNYDFTQLDAFLAAQHPAGRRKSFESLDALLPRVSGVVHQHRNMLIRTETQCVKLWNRKALYQIAEKFSQALQGADAASYKQALCSLETRLQELRNTEALRAVMNNIFMSLPAGSSTLRLPINFMQLLTEMMHCEDVDALREMTLEALRDMEPKSGSGGEFVEKIAAYVRANIADADLSLKRIAENHLFMNVDYVSKKFLRGMGCKFSAFLAQTRIETAMHLMSKEPAPSIASVAEAVGCGNNPQYFSQLFKKHTGTTPTEYAKNIGGLL